jgi:uncharacterized protein
MNPEFPQFKTLQLEDRDIFHEILWKYQPETSEWTFTNLFIWRFHYGFQWSLYKDWLLVLCQSNTQQYFAFQPMGPSPRTEVSRMFLDWLKEEKKEAEPRIERADQRLAGELEGKGVFEIEPTRDQFDYVYKRDDLVQLAGRKYHSKRNHINKFMSSYSFTYGDLSDSYLNACLDLSGAWCTMRRCEEDLSLMDEWQATREALSNFQRLNLQGGVIVLNDKVEAFSLGELLNERTGVVHIEKANPEIPGLYTMINQQFCEKNWAQAPYVNREQDLGEEGLRKAKLSYYPDHLVEKFRIRLAKKF